MSAQNTWPALPLKQWQDTDATLNMWTQTRAQKTESRSNRGR